MENPSRLFDFIHYQQAKFPQEKAFNHKVGDDWVHYSTDKIIELANKVSCGLLKLGVQPGDKIALATYKNRTEWVIMDIGMSQIGAINVPVYPTISPGEYEYIFNDAEVKLAFVGVDDLYDKVKRAQANVPSLTNIYTFDRVEGRPYWEEIFSDEGMDQVRSIMASIDPESLATIIYTSGTTGKPKGVMLSHHNIASNVFAVAGEIPLQQGDRVLSFLPLCHIFERTHTYSETYMGTNMYYTGTDNLGGEEGDIQAVKPHFFTSVPRLLEKVYEKIYAKGEGLSGMTKKLFFWALSLTEDFEYDKQFSGLDGIKRGLADKLIFSKWRAALGGEVKGILSGAAPLPAKIARVFSAAGIPIREGYGLTETSPGIAIGRFKEGGALLGTIGPILPGIDVMIDESDGDYKPDEGEILTKGPNIMLGYYNKPEATADVFKEIDGERWFRTGDIGKLVKGPKGQPMLKITDRKKELLKTSGGKYVAPAPIESSFKEEFLIEQIMVVGEQRKFVSALMVPSEEALEKWCSRNEIPWNGISEAIRHPKIVALYQSIVDRLNPNFSHIEQIKKFTLLDKVWQPSHPNGEEAELTPTLKLKRRVIQRKYEKEIEDLYNG
ncbi:AMP-dependent synthetase/ligase [Flavilitoribacter nigricans]|uniref:Long-chain fatty acid--CoA ligase n=1 Tax=Flavilitoribacter nigricans (strain ATCC 23147 / DSM 23189 / NBRC 102662 / NCIMB 1420 / SS-2) TaxID=1122177 RepID=A0A2D0NDX1_FLAN2|nr:long-chain fatty acid--CoA ligase [Flavilitoribacter nigricans]PHN06667.1 long-chain fatty acid--CoA ligase [Flavilitoribacter nigricans DSM 23189 = NBRC 102662]